VTLISSTIDNNQLTAEFERNIKTEDNVNDKSLEAEKCQNWQLPLTGGPLTGVDVGKHFKTPTQLEVN
jgi:hypothetical protein